MVCVFVWYLCIKRFEIRKCIHTAHKNHVFTRFITSTNKSFINHNSQPRQDIPVLLRHIGLLSVRLLPNEIHGTEDTIKNYTHVELYKQNKTTSPFIILMAESIKLFLYNAIIWNVLHKAFEMIYLPLPADCRKTGSTFWRLKVNIPWNQGVGSIWICNLTSIEILLWR